MVEVVVLIVFVNLVFSLVLGRGVVFFVFDFGILVVCFLFFRDTFC